MWKNQVRTERKLWTFRWKDNIRMDRSKAKDGKTERHHKDEQNEN